MALDQFNLHDQVAIVTGAGKGVGQGIARVLAEAGAAVVGTARTESDIVATIAGIEEAGGRGLAVVADAMSRSPPTGLQGSLDMMPGSREETRTSDAKSGAVLHRQCRATRTEGDHW